MNSSVKSEGVWILPRDDKSSCTFRGHDPSYGNVEAIEVASGGLAIGAPSCELIAGLGALTSGSRTMWLVEALSSAANSSGCSRRNARPSPAGRSG
jgi:hypothetical protein